MTTARFRLAATTIVLLSVSCASAAIVNFDGVASTSLPYTEAGLTFTNLPGTSAAVVVGGSDGYLVAGTNVLPIHVRVTGSQPFDLISLDIEIMTRTWRIESSTGAVFNPASTGTVDFTTLTGWTNLTSFDLIHDPGEANGSIRIDNIVFTPVPEPESIALMVVGAVGIMLRRRQLTSRRCYDDAVIARMQHTS